MKTLKILVIMAVVLLFASCASNDTANSDTVKQSEIYQAYSVTYDSGDKELYATASFRFGGSTGTTLHLVSPSSITFNGEEMALENNIFSGTFYEINEQTSFIGKYEFVFTDCDKKTYKNKIIFYPVEIIDSPQEFDKNNSFTVSWAGKLQNDERICLYIENQQNNISSVCTDIVGSTSIEMPAGQLKDFASGSANIYLTREMNISTKEDTHLGGRIFMKYVSRKVAVEIK